MVWKANHGDDLLKISLKLVKRIYSGCHPAVLLDAILLGCSCDQIALQSPFNLNIRSSSSPFLIADDLESFTSEQIHLHYWYIAKSPRCDTNEHHHEVSSDLKSIEKLGFR